MKTANFIVSFNVIFNIKAFGSKGMNRKKFWNCDNFLAKVTAAAAEGSAVHTAVQLSQVSAKGPPEPGVRGAIASPVPPPILAELEAKQVSSKSLLCMFFVQPKIFGPSVGTAKATAKSAVRRRQFRTQWDKEKM